MTKIILTRHGHVEGIKPERFRGREPLQLTERGAAEAAALAQRIAAAWRPTHIYTSPMSRCIATAAAETFCSISGADILHPSSGVFESPLTMLLDT